MSEAKKAMTRDEALKLLRGGQEGIAEWNRRRKLHERIPALYRIDLSRTDLSRANLSHAQLDYADLSRATLSDANLSGADLYAANLPGADLARSDLSQADLSRATLSDANLPGAYLAHSDLSYADLSDADLSDADLSSAKLLAANLAAANLEDATLSATAFVNVALTKTEGLEHVEHLGPSSIGTDTLAASRGRIPEAFLRGCGLQEWEIVAAKLYDPDLTPHQIEALQYRVFDLRASGPLLIGGVFISYTRKDADFVDKVREELQEKSIRVWVDRHDAPAGPTRHIVVDALRLHDVVLLVLSQHSVHSNWVDYELKKALQKEVDEGREVLCPVALDDAWHERTKEGHWREVREKNVLDFSKWEDEAAFKEPYQKLLKGLKIYYPPKDKGEGKT